ncbi:MAG: hypothetical protein HRU31_12350 [Rhodobacteraceae bacterium]|nr:hypothetical protein [Paracoccaceae bacterium]
MKRTLFGFAAILFVVPALLFAVLALAAYGDASHRCFAELPPSDTCKKAIGSRNVFASIAVFGALSSGAMLLLRNRQDAKRRRP